MRKYISAMTAAAALALLCGCAGGGGPAEPTAPPSDHVVISFDYQKQSGYASNQFAVWIEDGSGRLIKTLCATRFTASGGYKNRPDSLALWAEKSGLASMAKDAADAVTGATPQTGPIVYFWDLTDMDGGPVAPGAYRFVVEGSLRWKNRVVYAGVVHVDGSADTVAAERTFFFEASEDQAELTGEAEECGMIGDVTARYVVFS